MPTISPCLIRTVGPAGDPQVSLGVPLLDEYLEFLSGRCRPNTVLAVAYDLKVFFTVVGRSPKRVRPADVLAFMTAQRTGHGSAAQTVQPIDGERVGVSTRTLRRRLSSVPGLYAFLHVRGDVATNPVPRGLPTRRERHRPGQRSAGPRDPDSTEDPRAVGGRRAHQRPAQPPGPGDGRWCSVVCAVAR
jgi:integrase/recombinase XerD